MSSAENGSASSGGIGFMGVLFLVFLVMKLIHVIDWSWWWIAAPLWVPTGVVIGVVISMFFCLLIKEFITWAKKA